MKTSVKVIIGAILVIGIIIILFNVISMTGKVTDNSNKIEPTKITISQNNFIITENSYLNPWTHQDYCTKRRTGQLCKHTTNGNPDSPMIEESCPKNDIFTLKIKMVNLDEYYNQVYCKIYDNSNLIRDNYRDSYQPAGTTASDIGSILIPLDYMYSHNLMICCKVGDNNNPSPSITSNEVCLPNLNIDTKC